LIGRFVGGERRSHISSCIGRRLGGGRASANTALPHLTRRHPRDWERFADVPKAGRQRI
jgi:hypothetical protein